MDKTPKGLPPGNGWAHFPHDADIGVRGWGQTLEEAFAEAALALTAVVCEPSIVLPLNDREIAGEAPAHDVLLVDWLNAVIFEMSTQEMLFSRFDVVLAGNSLHATAWGETIDRARHHPAVEPKGATYTELLVAKNESGQWVAQCVIDV